jgi:hypothetical protein
MTLPLCLELPALEPFELTLPGGIEIADVNLMAIIQPALTPLVPFFNVIDTLVAIFNCIKAIPDSLGPPPSPGPLVACLGELGKKLARLLKMLPAVSLPLTVVRLLDLAIATLRDARRKLASLQKQMLAVTRMIDRAKKLEDAGLMAIAQCHEANVRQEAANVGKSLASLGRLLGLIELFMGLFGGPKVPSLTGLQGRPLDEVLEPIDALIKALQAARKAVPIP